MHRKDETDTLLLAQDLVAQKPLPFQQTDCGPEIVIAWMIPRFPDASLDDTVEAPMSTFRC